MLRVIVMLFVGCFLALAIVALTPVIFAIAAFLAHRRQLPFRPTLRDTYSTIETVFWQIIRTPFSPSL
jgi:hypothetical protein